MFVLNAINHALNVMYQIITNDALNVTLILLKIIILQAIQANAVQIVRMGTHQVSQQRSASNAIFHAKLVQV